MLETGNLTGDTYHVKEDILLENLIDLKRREKAKVLRLQQLKDYEERQSFASENTLARIRKKPDELRKVKFCSSSLVHDAIKEGNKFEVLDLLSAGVSINFNDVQGEGMSLLHQACIFDDYIIAQSLIQKGALINALDDYHCTPLHICCLWDSIKCAQLLLSNNASTSVLDLDSNFAVDLAAENSHLKAMMKKHMQQKLKIEEIRRRSGDQSETSGKRGKGRRERETPITGQLSSLRNKTQKSMLHDIKNLLEKGNSVDTLSSSGISLLHIAVANGYVSAARMLLENSANVNVSDLQLWTPLHCAAKYGQAKMVKLLLSHYANPHARTASNFIPRDLAKDAEIIKMLINAEETFLDLDNQRTPSKPKRFSASLLDERDGDEEITRAQSRIISSSRMSRRDVVRERELISRMSDQLKQELKREMIFQPPNIGSSFSTVASWSEFTPPPIPVRDDDTLPQYPTSPFVKHHNSTNLHDERLLSAVVTIQRAVRSHLLPPNRKLSRILQAAENCGNIFYEQTVIQNAEDIAQESDRQRSRKAHQRNSWSVEATEIAYHHLKQGRPLSTGHLLTPMSYGQDSSTVWLPQAQAQESFQNPYQYVPPDVVPYYSDPKRLWSTMPRPRGIREIPNINSHSIDSGVSMDSNSKDFIELTGTVKRSLTVKGDSRRPPPAPRESVPIRLRKSSLGALKPSTSQSTYKMPPLTPTVATLIHHTTSVTQDQESDPTRSKVIQPVDAEENYQRDLSAISKNRFHSLRAPSRDHRYGSMLSDRSRVLRDSRLSARNHDMSSSMNRHSWSCEKQANHTSSALHTPVKAMHPIISPPAAYEQMRFEDGFPPPPATPPPRHPPPPPATKRHSVDSNASSNTSPRPTTLRRRSTTKTTDGAPPPPPRRDPRTRLTGSSENVQLASTPRRDSLTSFQRTSLPSPPGQYENYTLPNRKSAADDVSDADDDLPVIPPPLPLYTPQAVIDKRNCYSDAAVLPPPPSELLYETPIRMTNRDEDFPPPPPTL